MRDSCIFYRSFLEAIELLPKKYQLSFFLALFNYALNDEPQIDANTRKYIAGCKGGRPKNNQDETKDKPKDNQDETKAEPNVNANANANANGKGNGSGSQANSDAPLSPEDFIFFKDFVGGGS